MKEPQSAVDADIVLPTRRIDTLDNDPRLGRDSQLMRLNARPAFRNLGRGVF
jgi:hypothetical protein